MGERTHYRAFTDIDSENIEFSVEWWLSVSRFKHSYDHELMILIMIIIIIKL